MPRKYRHLKDYEKELIEYIEQGHTLRETEKNLVLHIRIHQLLQQLPYSNKNKTDSA